MKKKHKFVSSKNILRALLVGGFITSPSLSVSAHISPTVSDSNPGKASEQIQTSRSFQSSSNSMRSATPGASASTGSQQKNVVVSGKVTDSKGEPLIGVTVLEKGTTNGAITDFDGNYSLTVSSTSSVLQYSYVGYKNVEMAATKR